MVNHQALGTVVVTKFAPPYACVVIDRVERERERVSRKGTLETVGQVERF